MRWKLLSRVIPPLLCASLCACAAAPAVSAAPATAAASLSAYVEPAASSVTLELAAPTAWSRDSAEVSFTITDNAGSGIKMAEVKVGRNGSWRDVTASLAQSGNAYTGTAEVRDNGPVALRVTGQDGAVHEKSCTVQCFDWSAPTVRAVTDGGKLCIEARDNRSGIATILVDDKEYAASDEKTMSVTIEDLDKSKEQITVQAVDKAGNQSAATAVDNPNYQPPKEDAEPEPEPEPEAPDPTPTPVPVVTTPPASTTAKPTDTPQPSGGSQTASRPDTSTAESGGASTGTSVSASADPEGEPDTAPRGDSALTPDGQGTVMDNATEEEGKEFFTITTANDNVFYLIVDQQRDSENVYFLNAVTEEDLLALAEPAEGSGESAVPDPEPVCTCEVKCEAGAVDTECPVCVLSLEDCAGEAPDPAEDAPAEPEPESGGAGLYVVIALVALAAGGAGWYFKIYKPKHDLDDAEDLDELTGIEEETVNEDEAEADYPDEPDYPDYYDDEPVPDDEAGIKK